IPACGLRRPRTCIASVLCAEPCAKTAPAQARLRKRRPVLVRSRPARARHFPAPEPVDFTGSGVGGMCQARVVPQQDADQERANELLARVLAGTPEGENPVTHVRTLPARPARCVPWPSWVPEAVARRFGECGVAQPWSHQAEAADHAWHGRHVILS